MDKESLTEKLLDLVEGRETPETWRNWWDEHETELEALLSRGEFLKLKPCRHGFQWVPVFGSQKGAIAILEKSGTAFEASNLYQVRYAWRNLDTDGEFCSLFRHRNGKHYLIFRTELYGYSVLEVESGQEMHYVPACVHPEEGQKAEEVFIWTGADYDPHTDLLAVTGCIWACPYSTIVLDFSCPLQPQPPERWLDLRRIVDPDDTQFNDIEFIRWEDGLLFLLGSDAEDDQWKEVRVSV